MASVSGPSSPSQYHKVYSNSEDPTVRAALPTKKVGVWALRQDAFRRKRSLKEKRQILKDERSAVSDLEVRFTKLMYDPLMQNSAMEKASIQSLHLELVRRREGLEKLMGNYDQSERDYNEMESELQEAEEKHETLIEDASPRFPNGGMSSKPINTHHQEANEAIVESKPEFWP